MMKAVEDLSYREQVQGVEPREERNVNYDSRSSKFGRISISKSSRRMFTHFQSKRDSVLKRNMTNESTVSNSSAKSGTFGTGGDGALASFEESLRNVEYAKTLLFGSSGTTSGTTTTTSSSSSATVATKTLSSTNNSDNASSNQRYFLSQLQPATAAVFPTDHLIEASEIKIKQQQYHLGEEDDYTITRDIKGFKWSHVRGKFSTNPLAGRHEHGHGHGHGHGGTRQTEEQDGNGTGTGTGTGTHQKVPLSQQYASQSNKTQQQFKYNYALKSIRPQVKSTTQNQQQQESTTDKQQPQVSKAKSAQETANYQLAVKTLLTEAIYLFHLQHPFILPFRGLCLGTATQYLQRDIDYLHLITDKMTETLEARITLWKQLQEFHNKTHVQKQLKDEFVMSSLYWDLAVCTLQYEMQMHKLPKRHRKEFRHLIADYDECYQQHPSYRDMDAKKNPADAGSDAVSGAPTSSHFGGHFYYPMDNLVALQTNYILQIAHALEYLHEKGIVVRDLRPNTIGFANYPNHHTIQLFHFGSCRELPPSGSVNGGGGDGVGGDDTASYNGRGLSPEPIQVSVSSGRVDGDEISSEPARARLSRIQSMKNVTRAKSQICGVGGAALSISRHGYQTNIKEEKVIRSNRTDAKHYRAPESYPFVAYQTQTQHDTEICHKGTNATGAKSLGSRGHAYKRNATHESNKSNTSNTRECSFLQSSDQTNKANNNTLPAFRRNETVESAASNMSATSQISGISNPSENSGYSSFGDNETTNTYVYNGYNEKADIYSLAMIYYEMMAEGRPFGKSSLERESHYYKVQSLGLRPSLDNQPFLRTVKVVLEQAWHPILEKRLSASKLIQTLTPILSMLEGKEGLPFTIRQKQKQQDLAANIGDSVNEYEQAVMMLPKRAAALMVATPFCISGGNTNGWSSVWKGNDELQKPLDAVELTNVIQAQRMNDKTAKKMKQKAAKNKPRQSRQRRDKSSSLRSWIPTAVNFGSMTKSDFNTATCEHLLGKGEKEKKRMKW